ncbi:TRPT1, partial [Symbiodinium necroappetens]
MVYERGTNQSSPHKATVGQVAPALQPIHTRRSTLFFLPPTVFTGKCSSDDGGNVALDIVSGQGTYDGFAFFELDLTTGYVRLAPSEELASVMPVDTHARATLSISCKIFGLYQYLPFGVGSSIEAELFLNAQDDTCFVPVATPPHFHEVSETSSSAAECRQACRSDIACTYYSHQSTSCFRYTGLCDSSSSPSCSPAARLLLFA